MLCYDLLKKTDSFNVFTPPQLFRNPPISSFFHFPWDFEIAGFNSTCNKSQEISEIWLVGSIFEALLVTTFERDQL